MKWFGSQLVKVLIIAGVLGFCWFAWGQIQEHENVGLKQQITQLQKELEVSENRCSKLQTQFNTLKAAVTVEEDAVKEKETEAEEGEGDKNDE